MAIGQINDDQNYKIMVDVKMTPSGMLRKNEVIRGKELKALILYNLEAKPSGVFYTETNKPLTK